MRRIIALVLAALATTGCSIPTAPSSSDEANAVAARKVLNGATSAASTARTAGRLAAN